MAFVDLIDRLLGVCERLFLVLANTCLAMMLAGNVVNIAIRVLFDKGLLFVFPWTVVLFIWMVFLGFFVVYRNGRDITVNFLVDALGPVARVVSRLLVNLTTIALLCVVLSQVPAIIDAQVGEMEFVGLERYTLSIPLFLSSALIVMHFLIDSIDMFTGREKQRRTLVGDI